MVIHCTLTNVRLPMKSVKPWEGLKPRKYVLFFLQWVSSAPTSLDSSRQRSALTKDNTQVSRRQPYGSSQTAAIGTRPSPWWLWNGCLQPLLLQERCGTTSTKGEGLPALQGSACTAAYCSSPLSPCCQGALVPQAALLCHSCTAELYWNGEGRWMPERHVYSAQPETSERRVFNADPNLLPLTLRESSAAGSDSSQLASAKHQELNSPKLLCYEITTWP